MRLGVSLSPGIFLPERTGETEERVLEAFGGADGLLGSLRGLGAGSVELRTVAPGDGPARILDAAERIWSAGLGVTVHGALPEEAVPFEEAYGSVLPLLRRAGEAQPFPVAFTVHARSAAAGDRRALAERTREILALWSRDAGRLGVRFALEENRAKGICDPGDSAGGVLEMLRGLPEQACGACFDFGHHFFNMLREGRPEETLPPPGFLRRTVHTHVHALGENGTHMPFGGAARIPLEAYVRALGRAGYGGIWDLELSFERFGDTDVRKGIRDSVLALRSAL